jgi:hypothetical protein
MHLGGAEQRNIIASAGGLRLDTLAINESAVLSEIKLPQLQVDLLQSLGVDITPAGRQIPGRRNPGSAGNSGNPGNPGNSGPGGIGSRADNGSRANAGSFLESGELPGPGDYNFDYELNYDSTDSIDGGAVPELPVEGIELYPLPEYGPELPSYNPLLD